MQKFFSLLCAACLLAGCSSNAVRQQDIPFGKTVTLSKDRLADKIRGGWCAQTIGCTYGGPTEFRYCGAMIDDYTPITWYDDYCADIFRDNPGLYDDVYMDLSFLETMHREGIHAPARSYALAFANAPFALWHANQAARHNILQGLMPPASGHWKNNPHADDIDFQIESDFIGMVCPGMPRVAAALADTIGHIMNYGDGWYGGVFTAAMYTYAFVSDDIPGIVDAALQMLPQESKYYQTIADVVKFHKQYPGDWRQCWLEIEKRHARDVGCPGCVLAAINIDATINGAYAVMGLLYGEGDFFKTMDIATRCGQDSDCNPATAAGILGVVRGYSGIPEQWRKAVDKCMDTDFPYTSLSLRKACDINLQLLEQVLQENGGKVADSQYTFPVQEPQAVRLEQGFAGHYPAGKVHQLNLLENGDTLQLSFSGIGAVLYGGVERVGKGGSDDYVARLSVATDGQEQAVALPIDDNKRKNEIYAVYELQNKAHAMTVRWLNPDPNFRIRCKDILYYLPTLQAVQY